jgi:hypothetical protein
MLPILDKLALRQTAVVSSPAEKQPALSNDVPPGTVILPEELLKHIISFGDCQSINKVCNSSKEMQQLCNDVTIFDQANARLEFYPEGCKNWAEVSKFLSTSVRYYTHLGMHINETAFKGLFEIQDAKAYFAFVCNTISELRGTDEFNSFEWWLSLLPGGYMAFKDLRFVFGNGVFRLLNVSLELYGRGVTIDPLETRRARPSDVLYDHWSFFSWLYEGPVRDSRRTRHRFLKLLADFKHAHGKKSPDQKIFFPSFESITSEHAYECLKDRFKLKWVYDPDVFGQPTLVKMYRHFLHKFYDVSLNDDDPNVSPEIIDQVIDDIAEESDYAVFHRINRRLEIEPNPEQYDDDEEKEDYKSWYDSWFLYPERLYSHAMEFFVDEFQEKLKTPGSWNDDSESDMSSRIDSVLLEMRGTTRNTLERSYGPGVFEILERLVLIHDNERKTTERA